MLRHGVARLEPLTHLSKNWPVTVGILKRKDNSEGLTFGRELRFSTDEARDFEPPSRRAPILDKRALILLRRTPCQAVIDQGFFRYGEIR
ncbi:hypothetical protein [Bradyrhizobium algeriense]|uniref:hypothetical protein n=1 Tax=Bradyrhizobium algeriense TaxID=634784 RepID=UPI00167C50B4|nr:hypothetical protein [Bradyrhizobium algeriense]